DGIRDPLVTGVQTCALPISTFTAGLATWTSGTTANYNVRRVLEILNTASKTPLERFEVHRLKDMLARDSTAGTATRYALVHNNEIGRASCRERAWVTDGARG